MRMKSGFSQNRDRQICRQVSSDGTLIKDTQRKMFLILDNLRDHYSKPVKAQALQNTQKIELFNLPIHSPELNPEERLNEDLQHAA